MGTQSFYVILLLHWMQHHLCLCQRHSFTKYVDERDPCSKGFMANSDDSNPQLDYSDTLFLTFFKYKKLTCSASVLITLNESLPEIGNVQSEESQLQSQNESITMKVASTSDICFWRWQLQCPDVQNATLQPWPYQSHIIHYKTRRAENLSCPYFNITSRLSFNMRSDWDRCIIHCSLIRPVFDDPFGPKMFFSVSVHITRTDSGQKLIEKKHDEKCVNLEFVGDLGFILSVIFLASYITYCFATSYPSIDGSEEEIPVHDKTKVLRERRRSSALLDLIEENQVLESFSDIATEVTDEIEQNKTNV